MFWVKVFWVMLELLRVQILHVHFLSLHFAVLTLFLGADRWIAVYLAIRLAIWPYGRWDRWQWCWCEDKRHLPCYGCSHSQSSSLSLFYTIRYLYNATTDRIDSQYTAQQIVMVHETPELYQRIVVPYIEGLPKSRTQWLVWKVLNLPLNHKTERCRVENILSGLSEQSKILHTCPEFVILPDMKWDLATVSSLYLVAIARDQNQAGETGLRHIHSMRDLRRGDLPWLKKIRREASKIMKERWNLSDGGVRFFIHYQPSYCETPFFLSISISPPTFSHWT